MKEFKNLYARKILEILKPLVGEYMAMGVLKTQTGLLGTNEDSIMQKDLPRLADGISRGLSIFLGSEASQKIRSQIAEIKQ
jgi:hypothetical protein